MLHQDFFSLAQTITKNESHTTYRLAQLLFNRGALPIFCLGYAYFRWLDDLIDAPSASSRTIESALKKQKELIAFLYQGQPPPELCHLNPYELMLHNLIEHDKTKGGDLRDYLMDMFSALEFDTQRRYQLSSQHSLDKYSWSLGRAYTNALWVFTSHQSVQINPLCYSAGYAAHQVHILRDFYIDLSLGYYNISLEELAAFGWSFNQLEKTDIRPWVGKMVLKAYAYFGEGFNGLKKVENIRCRFLGYIRSAQYIYVLEKIRLKGYYLQRRYQPSSKEKLRMCTWALKATLLPHLDLTQIEKNTYFASKSS